MAERRTRPVASGQNRTGHQIKKGVSPVLDQVNLTEIDRSDELFSMNFESDLGRLRASVKQIGVLEPIWLREKGEQFQIVSGFRRFDVAHSLGKRKIRALIWKEGDIDDRLAFEMSLHENVLTRGLNLVEKALVLEKLINRFSVSRHEAVQTGLPLLNMEPNESVLASLLPINRFSLDIKRYVLSHGVSLANVRRLTRFSREEQESICCFLSRLRVGENVLKEILTFLREISYRDGTKINDLLSSRRIQTVLSDCRLSEPQKVQGIRGVLREKRYPRLSELKQRFRSWREGIKLPPRVVITPPPFFEGDRFKIEIDFESGEEYKAILEELQHLSRQHIGDLLRIKGYGSDAN
jgi:hypothetical protein